VAAGVMTVPCWRTTRRRSVRHDVHSASNRS
jgi:hypothetical protein